MENQTAQGAGSAEAGVREKSQLMSASEIDRTLVRLAQEVVERHNGTENLVFVGIRRRGVPLAGWVANTLEPAMPVLADNLAALRAHIEAPLLGVVPHLAHRDAAAIAAVGAVPIEDAVLDRRHGDGAIARGALPGRGSMDAREAP